MFSGHHLMLKTPGSKVNTWSWKQKLVGMSRTGGISWKIMKNMKTSKVTEVLKNNNKVIYPAHSWHILQTLGSSCHRKKLYMTCDTWIVTCDTWHITRDMWHLTPDTWHMTYDTWHMTGGGRWTLFQNVSSLARTVWEWRCSEDISTKDQWVN